VLHWSTVSLVFKKYMHAYYKKNYAYGQNGSGWCSLMHSVSAMLYNKWWALRVCYLYQMITGCDWCLGYVYKDIKYKDKAIPFKAKALNTPRYQMNIPGVNYSLLSSGLNIKLLVLISILYSIADTECITHQWASNTAFWRLAYIFFLNTKRHGLILYQIAGHDAEYYTYVPQCNYPSTVFYLMQKYTRL